MESLMNAFSLNNVAYSYTHQSVIENVTIEIAQGKLTVLLGRNGSGKSTLIRLLARLISGYSGSIQCTGKELSSWNSREFSQMVGYVGQHHRPIFPFSVEDVILTGRACYVDFLPSKKDHDAVDEIIHELDLNFFRNRIYSELSGGEQQMILLARSLVNKPSILLLDEPTNHLDFTNQNRILTLIKTLVKKGITVISALHDPNLAFLFGDDILFLYNKNVLRDDENKAWDSPLLKLIIPSFDVISDGNNTFVIPQRN